MSRRQQLNVVAQVEAQPLGEHGLEQLEQEALRVARIGELVDQVPGASSGDPRLAGLADSAFEHGDAVLLEHAGLADDLVEYHRGHGPGLDQIAQQVARTYGRLLVVVTHQHYDGAFGIDGLEQLPGERDVDHRHFVDDDDVGVDRVLGTAGERLAVESEEPVDGAGLAVGDLLEPLGRLAGRGGEDDLQADLVVDRGERRDGVGLAASRAAADERDGVGERRQNGLTLSRVERGASLSTRPE